MLVAAEIIKSRANAIAKRDEKNGGDGRAQRWSDAALAYNDRVRPRRAIAVLLFLASITFQASFITLDAFPSDEGLVLVAAEDVSKGRLLYRDCYVPVTPGVYLIQGLAFKLFGSSFLVSRVLMSVVYALCVVLTFAIATGCLPLRQATLTGVLAIFLQVWMWPHAQFFSYNALAILFCVLAIRLAWSITARNQALRPPPPARAFDRAGAG